MSLLEYSHSLLVVESPSKCAKIRGFLDKEFGVGEFKVVATRGHLFEMDGLKCLDKKTFEPKYTLKEKAAAIAITLREECARARSVFLATDDDREGEAIAHHVCLLCGLDPITTPRIVFNEITFDAVIAGVCNPRTIDMHLVLAQKARAVLDMLVGYKISPLLWKYIVPSADAAGKKGSLSAGRCQTPTLRLIYEHFLQRSTNAPELYYYSVRAAFALLPPPNKPFEFSLRFSTEESLRPQLVREFLEESSSFAHKLLVDECKPTCRREPAPLPFNTCDLIQAAGRAFRYSPKETMSLCQTLYQDGHITYMRTDSRAIAPSFMAKLRQYVSRTYSSAYLHAPPPHAQTGEEQNAGAHECIRPTSLDTHGEMKRCEQMTEKHKNVYRLIFRQTVQSCMTSAEFKGFSLSICAPQNRQYTGTVEYPEHLGWRIALAGGQKTIQHDAAQKLCLYTAVNSLLHLSKNEKNDQSVKLVSADAIMMMGTTTADAANECKTHFSESSLVQKLQKLGIGRPSTYASLVDVIQLRGYVKQQDVPGTVVRCRDFHLDLGANAAAATATITETESEREFGREKAKLVLQRPLGEQVIAFLLRYFAPVFSYEYTADMEDKLDKVANGTAKWDEVCRECAAFLKTCTKDIRAQFTSFPLDEFHKVIFTHKCGPMIEFCGASASAAAEGGVTTSLKSIKPNITLDFIRLAEGKYSLEDLLDVPRESLGEYEGAPLYLKHGKYGYYVEWGENATRTSLRKFKLPAGKTSMDEVSFADIVSFLTKSSSSSSLTTEGGSVLRVVNENLSVRRGKGKMGPYLFFKTPQMKKAKFVSLRGFKEGFLTCDASLLEKLVV